MEVNVAQEGETLTQPLLESTGSNSMGPQLHPEEGTIAAAEQVAIERTISQPSEIEVPLDNEIPWYKSPLQLIAMLSNYSTSYNVVNISMVIPILEQTIPGTSSEDAAASASSLLAGMIVGQLLGGYLGDSPVLGRMGALQLVMAIQVLASIGSALIWSTLGRDEFFLCLAVFRFLLGVGAGGVYPLAAVLSAEQGDGHNATGPSSEGDESSGQQSPKQIRRVVLTFSTQGLGFITAPLVTTPLLYMTTNLNLVWRIILGLGGIPGIVMMAAQLWIHRKNSRHEPIPLTEDGHSENVAIQDNNNSNSQENDDDAIQQTENGGPVQNENENNGQNEEHNNTDGELLRNIQIMEEELRDDTGRWASIRREPNLVQKLLGTAGTWFLFDVLFYGNTLFQPIVMEAAFGSSKKEDPIDELRETAVKSLILASIALPGYAVAGIVMGKRVCYILQTPKFVMLQGFAAMGLLYFAIGTNWNFLRHMPVLLVLLYGMTFFFANYGPNTTTFIFPSLVFSPECRTTLNGVSAAAGKLGALTGATLFEPAADSMGDASVMLICAGIAVISFLMTWKFVKMHPTTSSQHHAL